MSFYDDVYEVVRKVPKGHVITYGQIAMLIGRPKSSRVVGYALHVNPDPDGTPCFRVVNRWGRLADSFAFGGVDEQKRRLIEDGIEVRDDNTVDLEKYGIQFETI